MDTAALAAQSDPTLSRQFRRRWAEGPPQKRKGPETTDIVQGPHFENGSSEQEHTGMRRALQWAASLDRFADLELSLGRHTTAERLSHQAAELRGASR